ncbi:hypothetical protein EBZ80_20205 [bacterium]|nr:hypothetical protein [bacterium]
MREWLERVGVKTLSIEPESRPTTTSQTLRDGYVCREVEKWAEFKRAYHEPIRTSPGRRLPRYDWPSYRLASIRIHENHVRHLHAAIEPGEGEDSPLHNHKHTACLSAEYHHR